MSNIQTVEVPPLGDFSEVEIIEMLVAPGDTIETEQTVFTLESDKAAMEIPSPVSGTIVELLVKIGDKVSTGTPFAKVDITDEGATTSAAPEPAPTPTPESASEPTPAVAPTPAPTPAPAPASVAPVAAPAAQPIPSTQMVQAHASPSVRKLARELEVNLTAITGTGPHGRILDSDLKAYVKKSLKNRRRHPHRAPPRY